MRGIIPLLIWRGYLVVFLAPTGADVKRQSFAELYEAGSRVIASVVTPVSTKTTPSLLSCMHACVRGKKCAGFNYCRTQTKKDEHNCEMFETDRFMNDKDKTIKPYEDCSIYLLNKVDNQPLAQKVNACDPNPCQQGGTCNKGVTSERGYTCECISIKSLGEHCEIDIDFSLLFGPPVSYMEVPFIPKFTGQELSLCFVLYLFESSMSSFQNIFQLYETTNCQMIVAMKLNLRSVVIQESSKNTTINNRNMKKAAIPICFRWSIIRNKWAVSVRGRTIGSGSIAKLNPSPKTTASTISLNIGGPDIVDNLEVCTVPEASTQRSLDGKMFNIMIYNSFISEDAIENNMKAKWHIDDSLLMTMQDFKNVSQYAKGNVTKEQTFTT